MSEAKRTAEGEALTGVILDVFRLGSHRGRAGSFLVADKENEALVSGQLLQL